jgi:hypothetical protein
MSRKPIFKEFEISTPQNGTLEEKSSDLEDTGGAAGVQRTIFV